jgi:hypothetical protein
MGCAKGSQQMAIENTHDKVANVLGHFVLGFSELEIALGGAIMRLLKQDDRVGAVFAGLLSFSNKLEVLHALDFKIERQDVRDQFKELLQKAREINTERNRLVHGEYRTVGSQDSYAMMVSRLKDSHKYDFRDGIQTNLKYIQFFNVDRVMDLANDASLLSNTILNFSEQFNPGGA